MACNASPCLAAAAAGSTTDTGIDAPVARLASIMQQLGHDRLDILKLDIEGGEYAVLQDLLSEGIPARQLLLEFHHHFPGIGINATVEVVQALQAAGFRIFHISARGREMSLVPSM